jgi:hypothetical protein
MGGACSMHGEEDVHVQVIGGKARRTVPLGRPRERWRDSLKMHSRDIGRFGVDWSGLAQVRKKLRALVNSVMILQVP